MGDVKIKTRIKFMESLIRMSCLLEATARKVGNVHPAAEFQTLKYADFVASARAVAPILGHCEALPDDRETDINSVGNVILNAVRATREVCDHNTNLGIILLLAPLVAAARRGSIRHEIDSVLKSLDVADSAAVFKAIRVANPRGLGEAPEQDVQQTPTQGLVEIMQMAADRDSIAAQYTTNFDLVLNFAVPILKSYGSRFATDWERAIIELQIRLMAHQPDTDIARKCGWETAHESAHRAAELLTSEILISDQSQLQVAEFDAWLRAEGSHRNPGTTADLITAALFVALQQGDIVAPDEGELTRHAAELQRVSVSKTIPCSRPTRPCGVINIDKPQGRTSADVVNRVAWLIRKATGIKKLKVGHCGTLDPMATGVLLICVGSATRLVPLIQEHSKTYRAKFLLGRTTDTDDITGKTLAETDPDPNNVDASAIERLLPEFTGKIQQVPPQFSAVHVNGQRAYDLAREGQTMELAAREVTVDRLELVSFAFPEFELEIECGTGTYIRSIGRDLGQRLGCGATMTQLVRSSIGSFAVRELDHPPQMIQAVPLDELTLENVVSHLEPAVNVLPDSFPRYGINDDELARIRTGRSIHFVGNESDSRVALLTPSGDLASIAEYVAEATVLQPTHVFVDANFG